MQNEKKALVVQGGSLRSIFSAGVLDALMVKGFNPFDICIGVSGGSMCLSYYLSEQYRSTYDILSKIFKDDKFISIRNFFSTEGYINLSYLEQYAMREHPLNFDIIEKRHADKQIEVVTTCMRTGEPFYIRPNRSNWLRALRASSTLPFLTKGYCEWKEPDKASSIRLMDGGWSDPIPVKRAIELGATKIVVIRTHPADYRLDWSYLGWFGSYWHRKNPQLSRRFSNDHEYYNETIDFLERDDHEVTIHQIAPKEHLATSNYSTNQTKIDTDYRLGLDLANQFLIDHSDMYL